MNEMRRIRRSDGAHNMAAGSAAAGAHSAALGAGRRVNTAHSRKEDAPPPKRPAGETGSPAGGRDPKGPKKDKKEKKGHPILRGIFRLFVTLFCLGVMAGCALAVCMVFYVVHF